MKPIIITLLALPIVGFLRQPASPHSTESSIVVAPKHSKLATPKVTAVKTDPPKAVDPPAKPKVVAKAVTPAPAPKPVVYTSGCSSYLSDFEKYPWPVTTAVAICQAESTGNPYAEFCGNWDGVCDFGLMQLHGIEVFNPAQNIADAYYMKYLPSGGFTPWTTYTSGKYLNYLQ